MKREFIIGTAIDIQRRLRRSGAKLIRMIPRRMRDHTGEVEAYVVLYI